MKIIQIPIYETIDNKKHIIFKDRVTPELIANMEVRMGSYAFSCSNLLNPVPEADKKFRMAWVLKWKEIPPNLKIVICIDPANSKNKSSDYTAITVHGWDEKQNWYILDIYRDKLDLEDDRAKKIIELHKKWSRYSQMLPIVLYETINFQILDKHNLDRKMRSENYFFEIVEMKGGRMHKTSKMERIKSLQPYFEANEHQEAKKLYIPQNCYHYSQWEKKRIDMVQEFIYEFMFFTPNNTHKHDDILDTCTFPLYWDRFAYICADTTKAAPASNFEFELEKQFNRISGKNNNPVIGNFGKI